MSTVRTLLGDIPAAGLGVCDAHDHLFLRSPLLPGQERDDPVAAEAELRDFRALGGTAVAQWTPYGMGRELALLARLSQTSGVHVIAATGLHQAVHYDAELLGDVRDRLAGLFVAELTRAELPAGLIKVAGGYHGLDGHARLTMTAAAEAHHATGAPIGVHLEGGTGAADVLGLLCGDLGVAPDAVILGHLNRFPDIRVHREAAEAGAFLAFDGPSRANHATDWRLLDCLTALAEAGHTDRLLLGGDSTVRSALGVPYLLSGVRPRVERELGERTVSRILTENAARAFALRH